MKITKAELIEFKACKGGLQRFVKQYLKDLFTTPTQGW